MMLQECLGLLVVGLAVAAVTAAATGESRKTGPASLPFVPWPPDVELGQGELPLGEGSRIVAADEKLVPLARILAEEIFRATGLRLPVARGAARDGDVVLELGDGFKGEDYLLTVAGRATVRGGKYEAVALGTVTLLQALRSDGAKVSLPRLVVRDGPRLHYCGAMLDCARKPYSLATLKQCVQVCRFYKIRYLHLHLSDENAWTFPSAAFPRLGSQNFAWAGGAKPAVYDRDGLKDLVAFADARGVTLIPELEVPGHSGQLRGTLPDVFGYRDAARKTVSPGVINMVREESYAALDTLVGEMSDVFRSSPYFHIGCDEAAPAGIEQLPEVRAFMQKHHLASADAVFNHFVNRMDGIVKKHGKRTVVWEGAPLGPAPPPRDVIFMPWVGGAGAAAELVKRGYAVINPPWGTPEPYFDPYLVNGAQLRRGEPLLLGATSLLWEKPEEEAVPFLRSTGALRNEPIYNPDAARGHADFLRRLRATEPLLDRLLYGFAFRAGGTLDPLVNMRPDAVFTRNMTLSLVTSLAGGELHYTLDGTEPDAHSPAYGGPIRLAGTTTVKARWFGGGDAPPWTFARTYRQAPAVAHDAVGARVMISPEHLGYPGPGPKGLTDGLLADGDEASSGGWVGWARGEQPVEVRIDLGRPTPIQTLGAHFLRAAGGIALPAQVEFAVSDDGKTFRAVAAAAQKAGAARRGWFMAELKDVTARHVRMRATAGGDWTFLDEVAVNPKPDAPTLRHAALGRPVTLASPPSAAYDAPGVQGLTDGFLARSPDFLNPQWLGIEGKDLDATIDLGRVIELREVGGHFLQHVGAGIHIPGRIDVLVSEDGKAFRTVAAITHRQDDVPAYTRTLTAALKGVRGRFVRVVAHTNGQWLFADEILVNPEPGARAD